MTIILGQVCDNTCFGYQPGDNTPDFLGLFGPVFGELVGPFTLDIGAASYSLTVNSHTLTFPFTDPHLSISFTNPLLASFASGSFMFTATGSNPFGLITETEFFCPVPGVPEPGVSALFVIGFAILTMIRRRRPQGRFTPRVL